ncbi:MAG: PEP-CTERM sorting domain-containing protein [Opitutales bacterium]
MKYLLSTLLLGAAATAAAQSVVLQTPFADWGLGFSTGATGGGSQGSTTTDFTFTTNAASNSALFVALTSEGLTSVNSLTFDGNSFDDEIVSSFGSRDAVVYGFDLGTTAGVVDGTLSLDIGTSFGGQNAYVWAFQVSNADYAGLTSNLGTQTTTASGNNVQADLTISGADAGALYGGFIASQGGASFNTISGFDATDTVSGNSEEHFAAIEEIGTAGTIGGTVTPTDAYQGVGFYISPIPEPASAGLLAAGAIALGLIRRRR